jgi:hypothetical protein
MPTPREVTANVSAMNAQLDHALVNDVQAILASVRDQKWPSGRPEYNS